MDRLGELWDVAATPMVPRPPDVDESWLRLERRLPGAGTRTHDSDPRQRGKLISRLPSRIAVAGLLVVVILASLVSTFLGEAYRTGSGQRLTVSLQDSSTVILAGGSALSMQHGPFGFFRKISLDGEGFFSLKPQARPFEISTPVGVVRVVGTQFNVRSSPELLYVAVVRGAVAVSSPSGRGDSTVVLHEGEFTLCRMGSFPSSPTKSMATGEPMWLSGSLRFSQAGFRSVCDEVGRQINVRIEFRNHDLDTLHVTGLIKGSDPQKILSALCGLTRTSFRKEGNAYVVY